MCKGFILGAQGHLASETYQTGFVIAGGRFLSNCNHQQIKFEDKRFGLCNYEMRER
jgi:hypothetical protein